MFSQSNCDVDVNIESTTDVQVAGSSKNVNFITSLLFGFVIKVHVIIVNGLDSGLWETTLTKMFAQLFNELIFEPSHCTIFIRMRVWIE